MQLIGNNNSDHFAFSEYNGHGTRGSAFMIRKDKWKYIHYCAAEDQLFNLEVDPNELENVACNNPDVVRDLDDELKKIYNPERKNQRAEEFISNQLRKLKN